MIELEVMERVCVFSGSRPGVRLGYRSSARALGEAIARRGLGLVYGGSSAGLMGQLADAAMAAGAEVVGVIPEALVAKEVAHEHLTRLVVVKTMHERKAMMADLADAFVALPGGFGTLEELFEIVTWAQLGMHAKPIALLDAEGYFRPLVAMVEHAVAEGFVPDDQRALLLCHREPDALLDALAAWTPPVLGRKWIDERET
jgi:uncharacterized protein (TIGR00730 family)